MDLTKETKTADIQAFLEDVYQSICSDDIKTFHALVSETSVWGMLHAYYNYALRVATYFGRHEMVKTIFSNPEVQALEISDDVDSFSLSMQKRPDFKYDKIAYDAFNGALGIAVNRGFAPLVDFFLQHEYFKAFQSRVSVDILAIDALLGQGNQDTLEKILSIVSVLDTHMVFYAVSGHIERFGLTDNLKRNINNFVSSPKIRKMIENDIDAIKSMSLKQEIKNKILSLYDLMDNICNKEAA